MSKVLENLKDLEQFLAGEVRSFRQDAEIAKEKGFGKAVAYCLGCSMAYESALGRLRAAMPGRLIDELTRIGDREPRQSAQN